MSVINLLDEKPLNNYLQDLVYNGAEPTVIKVENTDDARENMDAIARNILFQYIKRNVRDYVRNDINLSCFVKVDKNRTDLPDWTKNTFARGEDIYEFDVSKVPDYFRKELLEIRDYLFSVATDYVQKECDAVDLSNGKKKLRIEYDYLKKSNEYKDFNIVLHMAENWHLGLVDKQITQKQKQDADNGTKFIMDLGEGISVYQLMTPAALDYEGNMMGNCVGAGAYDKGVIDGDIQIYSVRDAKGSHVTIEVRNNKFVYQIKGKQNEKPVRKYIPAVQKFILNKDFDLQGGDYRNIDMLQINGRYYDMFNLPKGMVIEQDISFIGEELEELPDFSNVDFRGSLRIGLLSKNKSYDLSKFEKVALWGTDLSDVDVQFNPNAKSIEMEQVTGLHGDINFSKVKKLYVSNTGLSDANIHFNPNANEISLILTGPSRQSPLASNHIYDFGGVKYLRLGHCMNLAKSNVVLNRNAKQIHIDGCGDLCGRHDLSKVKNLRIDYTDLSNADITFNRGAESVWLYKGGKLPTGYYDLSEAKQVVLWDLDCSKANIIFNSHAEGILLANIKNLSGIHDFSGVKTLSLENPKFDLTDKTKVVFKSKKSGFEKGSMNLKKKIKTTESILQEQLSDIDRI